MRTLAAEASKLASLPSVWIALAAGVLVPSVIAGITASATLGAITRGAKTLAGVDTGYQELAFGVVGVIILGVVGISSEYFTESAESGGGRQVTTSLTAVPSRLRFLLAKISTIAITSALLAITAAATTMGVVQVVLGERAPALGADDVPRLVGVVCYWVYTALLAFGITVLTRHGVIPLAVLIANTSVVTVTYLLTKITPLANYLPDMAGVRMFIRKLADNTVEISPLTGGLVMTAWVTVLLVIAAIAFTRRDA
ncbi:ABC transporter permease [Planotetraspora sp. A-T 1434]|uniref:ABC transporter permease n=1 Tax=Planotetraspora sp. A-T 1434 TaxID=2979219 RepID=UPI0021BFAC0A|nr:ABC transporter permease [Planotetraspora sp. A-T 1434]MCT9929918.1 ABC transporter permease [Planotetraspora sp. A-T 1434]